jgi:hypothetical protein
MRPFSYFLIIVLLGLIVGVAAYFGRSDGPPQPPQKPAPEQRPAPDADDADMYMGSEDEEGDELSDSQFFEGLITVDEPASGDMVDSPLRVSGKARGGWYHEAVFPVRLIDENGKVLAESSARAKGEWTTEEFVPFEATLSFDPGTADSGTLVLERSNPSDLPENDQSVSVPVGF